jgi:hypothetical protein
MCDYPFNKKAPRRLEWMGMPGLEDSDCRQNGFGACESIPNGEEPTRICHPHISRHPRIPILRVQTSANLKNRT